MRRWFGGVGCLVAGVVITLGVATAIMSHDGNDPSKLMFIWGPNGAIRTYEPCEISRRDVQAWRAICGPTAPSPSAVFETGAPGFRCRKITAMMTVWTPVGNFRSGDGTVWRVKAGWPFRALERRVASGINPMPGHEVQRRGSDEPLAFVLASSVLWPALIADTVCYAAILGSITMLPGTVRRHRRRQCGACLACGHTLIPANPSCPECGHAPSPRTGSGPGVGSDPGMGSDPEGGSEPY